MQEYKGWCVRVARRVDEEGRLLRYTIHFDRRVNDWYDEIRDDSFEVRDGKRLNAPHLHITMRPSLKTIELGIAEIQEIIERHHTLVILHQAGWDHSSRCPKTDCAGALPAHTRL